LGLTATTAPAAPRQIDPSLVEHWMNLRRVLDRHAATYGTHAVRDTVEHEIDLIAAHRQVARGELHTKLLRVEARWSDFAGWLGYDVGDSPSRDAWADRALRIAREADWADMVAYVHTRRSHWSARDGDARSAIRFADAAHGTRGVTVQVRASSALKQAYGRALAGDATACERSLAEAHGYLDGGATETGWDGIAGIEVSPFHVRATEARCWLWLRPSRGVATFEDVLRVWPSDRTRDRGVQQARLALACATADEPDRAAAEGMKALGIAQSTRSDVTVRELRRLDRQLAGCDAPAAADFREAFATL
jgi:hypothetical protein